MSDTEEIDMDNLEEVVLVNPPQVVLSEKAEITDPEVLENPGWTSLSGIKKKMFRGVAVASMVGGVGGLAGAFMVPKVLKWNTGIKDILATLGVVGLGGLLIGGFSPAAATGFVITATAVLILKGVKWAASGFKNVNLSDQEELFDVGYDIYDTEDDGEDDYDDEDIYGVDDADDVVVPTNGIDAFDEY